MESVCEITEAVSTRVCLTWTRGGPVGLLAVGMRHLGREHVRIVELVEPTGSSRCQESVRIVSTEKKKKKGCAHLSEGKPDLVLAGGAHHVEPGTSGISLHSLRSHPEAQGACLHARCLHPVITYGT
eukprot:1158311-Pelagomonas_calceolata.AAC.12